MTHLVTPRHLSLGDVVRFGNGKSIKPGGAGEHPVYGSNGIIGGSDEYRHENGIIIGRVGAYCGSVAYCKGKFWASDNTLVAFPASPEFDIKYLFYLLCDAKLGRYAGGAAQPLVTQTALRGVKVSVLPLPLQRHVAGILSAYDGLVENNQRRIRILQELARSLYSEWFVKFQFPGRDKIKLVDSSIGRIPQGWAVKSLESLMMDHIGGGWGKDAPDGDHIEPAWVIRGTDIPDARFSQVHNVPRRFHTSSNLRSRMLSAGDILFEVSGGSKGQPVGRTLLVSPSLLSAFGGEPVICASFCKRVRPNPASYGAELLYLSFLEGYESGEIEQFQVQSTGISNFKWTEYIKQVQRAVPPELLRERFRESVAPLFMQIGTLGLQIANLRRARDLLLPRLLSGQIDVSRSLQDQQLAA